MYPLLLAEGGKIQRFLSEQWFRCDPRSGSYYQLIELFLKDGRIIPNIKAYHAEVIELPEKYKDVTEDDIEKVTVYHGEEQLQLF